MQTPWDMQPSTAQVQWIQSIVPLFFCTEQLDSQTAMVVICPQDYEAGSLYGLEKFWAFHHYGGIPEGFDVEIHAKVTCRELVAGEVWESDADWG